MSCWKWNKVCLEEEPEGYKGFVYKITDPQGKIYIGKKAFTHRRKKRLTKKEKLLPGNSRKTFSITAVNSKWQEYWGSCKDLSQIIIENGTKGFKREILCLCTTVKQMTYYELKYQFLYEVLEKDTYNGNIMSRFFRKDLE